MHFGFVLLFLFFPIKPGQSFSFVANNVKGQELNDQDVTGAKAIGAGGSALDLNMIKFDGE